eukprot:CCRYP_001768-RA/>CCRYP_001768-RA protein AED:0.36 eAED:0.36 QI:0/-1/0/1/-1/1/1/0/412
MIGKSAAAKSPYAQEMYAKAAAATLADESNNKTVSHHIMREDARPQNTMVAAPELSSKRQKFSSNFDVEEDTEVESGNEDETPDSDDEESEYQPTQSEPTINFVGEVTRRRQGTLKRNNAQETKSYALKVCATRQGSRKKNGQNAGDGRNDGVVADVSTTRKKQGRNANNAMSFSSCPHELKKSRIDHLSIRHDPSIDSIDMHRVNKRDQIEDDEPWVAADSDALFDEESNNDDVQKWGITLTRNVHPVYTQREVLDHGSHSAASREDEDTGNKHNLKRNSICVNEPAAVESSSNAMSFVEFNTRYISNADRGIILAEIQKEDSEPSTPSQGSASNSRLPLSAVSLSNEKPRSQRGFVQKTNAIDAMRSNIMVKLSKKINDVNEVVKQLGIMMEEVNSLASSAELTYGRDLN